MATTKVPVELSATAITITTAAQPNITSVGTLTSLGLSGNVTLGDNNKTIFGAGDDLEIYHDGSHSYIKDTGTGNLFIDATSLRLRTGAGTENYLVAEGNGAVTLYYDNAAKLATTSTGIDVTGRAAADNLHINSTSGELKISRVGSSNNGIYWDRLGTQDAAIQVASNEHLNIDNNFGNPINFRIGADGSETTYLSVSTTGIDVTGTVTADDLTVDTSTLVVDATNNRVGIGTNSPAVRGEIKNASSGAVATSGTTQTNGVLRLSSSATTGVIDFGMNGSNPFIQATDSGGLNNFYNLILNPAGGNVGIGVTNPSEILQIEGATVAGGDNYIYIRKSDQAANQGILIGQGTNDNDLKITQKANNNIVFEIGTTPQEAVRITNSRQLGINNNNPDHLLDVHGDTNSIIASLDHTGFDSRQVGLPGRFMVGPKGNGYPWAGYNFSHVGDNLTYLAGDYAWAISYGNLNRLSFNFATNGSAGASLSWLERAHIDTDGHFNVGASSPGGRLFNVSAGSSRDIASFTDDNVGLVIQAKSDGSDFTEIVSYRDQDSTYDKLGLRGANYGIVIDASNGNVGVGGELSPAHALEVETSNNYEGVHIRGSNAPCFTIAQGTSSTASWRMGISGYDGNDFAISSGASTNDKLRVDPDGNFVMGNVNNVTPKTGMHNTTSVAMFPGPVLSGRSQGAYQSSYLIARDWFVYAGPTTNTGSYVHMKTDLWGGGSPSGNTDYTMSCFRYHSAYAYGAGTASGMIGWHNWSGSLYNSSKHNDTSWSLVQDSYISTDGYVVLVAYLTHAYASFSIDWHQWAGYTFREAKVTNVGQHSAATGLY